MRLRWQSDRFRYTAGIVTGLLFTLGLCLHFWRPAAQSGPGLPPLTLTGINPPAASQPIHVLVLGVDERKQDVGRSDSMLLVRIAPGHPVRLLSLPRDTRALIAGYGHGKLNSAYTYGGSALAKQTVANLLGLPVHYYIKVNLAGFRRLVDLMGGVTFHIDRPMRYVDPYDDLVIDLKPGTQVLDGAKAEQFVRFRYDPVGDDVSRIHRQQEFLKAVTAQALTPSRLPVLPKMLYTAARHVETDMPLTEQLRLAEAVFQAEQRDAIVTEVLPGHGEYVDGISFFLPDRAELHHLVRVWHTTPALP